MVNGYWTSIMQQRSMSPHVLYICCTDSATKSLNLRICLR